MGHMALLHVVRDHAFTQGLSTEQIARLASLAAQVSFEEGDLILEEGQHSESFYLLLTGSVAIELRSPQFTVCVQALEAGQAFGWSSLLDHQDTLFRVRAREYTTALRINGADLAAACQADSRMGVELLRRMLKLVAGRVKATEAKFAEMCGVRPSRLTPR
jgi:CRP-like cAMP-binding protein